MGNLLTQWSTLSVIDILVVPQLDFYDRIHMIMSRLDWYEETSNSNSLLGFAPEFMGEVQWRQ